MTKQSQWPIVETKIMTDVLGRRAIERWENEGGVLIVAGKVDAVEPEAQADHPTFVAEPIKGFESRIPISGRSKCLTHSATNENDDAKVGSP